MHGVKPLEGQLGRNLRVLGDQRLVGRLDDLKLVLESFEVGESQSAVERAGLVAGTGEPLGPELERLRAGHTPNDPVNHACAGPTPKSAGILEKRDIRAGVAVLVGVEQVVDRRVVLVYRLLHQPQTEDSGVEVDISLRFGSDRGDVVDAFELHRSPLVTSARRAWPGRRRAARRSPARSACPPGTACRRG